jgi:hypothetical protein
LFPFDPFPPIFHFVLRYNFHCLISLSFCIFNIAYLHFGLSVPATPESKMRER